MKQRIARIKRIFLLNPLNLLNHPLSGLVEKNYAAMRQIEKIIKIFCFESV